MKMIDSQTVQRILDAADIVEVVSDYVSLKRVGADYVGLCPFHADRRPSFRVSRSKGICKCFSCQEGGSPVNFIMKIEQLTYPEALRVLAKKYNIEIDEHEMTDEDRRKATARENMFIINKFASDYFRSTLLSSDEGRAVGLSYFRHRGISDKMIERFCLGYSLSARDAMLQEARRRGYDEGLLEELGLITPKGENYGPRDRFRERVIFPVFTVSGRVVAFGGRILKNDPEKKLAKYVNSKENDVYQKRRELYGLYQAKNAIRLKKKCIVVEGYLDVISMHQAGVENVVASSGTALTLEQVRLIHRFTSSVTLVYDADSAGVKASLRGIELFLAEGMDVKLLKLPPGEDPDSFAQSHTGEEVQAHFEANETGFVQFMLAVLMDEVGGDPARRADVITRIVKTIALIPDEIKRSVFVQESAGLLGMDENLIRREVGRYFNEYKLKGREELLRGQDPIATPNAATAPQPVRQEQPASRQAAPAQPSAAGGHDHTAFMRTYEGAVVQLALRYANFPFAESPDDASPVTVVDYIVADLAADGITFLNADLARLLERIHATAHANWTADYAAETERLAAVRQAAYAEGEEKIRANASDVGSIAAMETKLREKVDQDYAEALADYAAMYVGRILTSCDDPTVMNLATAMFTERHVLSKMHTKYAHIETERDLLGELVPRTLCELKDAILATRQKDLELGIKRASEALVAGTVGPEAANAEITGLMEQLNEVKTVRGTLAKLIGDRVVAPRKC